MKAVNEKVVIMKCNKNNSQKAIQSKHAESTLTAQNNVLHVAKTVRMPDFFAYQGNS